MSHRFVSVPFALLLFFTNAIAQVQQYFVQTAGLVAGHLRADGGRWQVQNNAIFYGTTAVTLYDANGDALWSTSSAPWPGEPALPDAEATVLPDDGLVMAWPKVQADSSTETLSLAISKFSSAGQLTSYQALAGPVQWTGGQPPSSIATVSLAASEGRVFAAMSWHASGLLFGSIGDTLAWCRNVVGQCASRHAVAATIDGGALVLSTSGVCTRFDAFGNKLWSYRYSDPGGYAEFVSVEALPDGTFRLLGRPGLGDQETLILAEVDASGSPLGWHTYYPVPAPSNECMVHTDGSALLVTPERLIVLDSSANPSAVYSVDPGRYSGQHFNGSANGIAGSYSMGLVDPIYAQPYVRETIWRIPADPGSLCAVDTAVVTVTHVSASDVQAVPIPLVQGASTDGLIGTNEFMATPYTPPVVTDLCTELSQGLGISDRPTASGALVMAPNVMRPGGELRVNCPVAGRGTITCSDGATVAHGIILLAGWNTFNAPLHASGVCMLTLIEDGTGLRYGATFVVVD